MHSTPTPIHHSPHQEAARLEYDLTVAAFDTFDIDGDGMVTVEEMAQTLVGGTGVGCVGRWHWVWVRG